MAEKFTTVKMSEQEMHSAEVDVFISKLDKAIKKNKNVLLDLSAVQYINSGRMGVLIRKHKDLKMENGGLSILCPQGDLRSIFVTSGVSKILDLFEDEEAYLKFLESR